MKKEKINSILVCSLAICFSSCGFLRKPASILTSNNLLIKQELKSKQLSKQIPQTSISSFVLASTFIDSEIITQKNRKQWMRETSKTPKKPLTQTKINVGFAIPIILDKTAKKKSFGTHSATANFSKISKTNSNVFSTLALAFLIVILAVIVIFFVTINTASLALFAILLLIGGFSAICSLVFFILGLIFH